jgi:hypothetical protein
MVWTVAGEGKAAGHSVVIRLARGRQAVWSVNNARMCARVLSRVREGANKRAGETGHDPAISLLRPPRPLFEYPTAHHRCVKPALAPTLKLPAWPTTRMSSLLGKLAYPCRHHHHNNHTCLAPPPPSHSHAHHSDAYDSDASSSPWAVMSGPH